MLAACSTPPRYHANGKLLGERVSTSVDSKIARYYLEHYLQGERRNQVLDDKIDEIYERQNSDIPTRDELRLLSNEYSVDFATLFLVDRLQADRNNEEIKKQFDHFLNNTVLTELESSAVDSYLVLFVPGWDYIENGHFTGSDFAVPRKLITQLGIENHLVEIPSNGGVEENAQFISDDLIQYSQTGKDIIIVGASSAGPAIHLSLAGNLKKHLKKKIKAWVNIGGILRGSPLIDHYQKWPQSWLFGIAVWYKEWDREKILSMSASRSRERFASLDGVHENTLIINYMGLSLSGQLSKYAKENYLLLKKQGPNDGLTLLSDIIAPNSLTIVAIGSDHFFAEDPRINDKTIALMKVVISYLEKAMHFDN